jgi:hypothetical protein
MKPINQFVKPSTYTTAIINDGSEHWAGLFASTLPMSVARPKRPPIRLSMCRPS